MRAGNGLLVTVAVPTVGRPEMLRCALKSVLEQSHRELQVVVSDNASQPEVLPLVRSFGDPRMEVQRHESRLAMADNWNTCLSAARGRYFLLLSDDDALEEDAVEKLLSGFVHLETGEGSVGVSYGRTRVVDDRGRSLWLTRSGPKSETAFSFAEALFLHRRALYPCATMIRTEDLRELGGYDGHLYGGAADVGACLGAAFRRGRVSFEPSVVCRYTEHAANLTAKLCLEGWRSWLEAVERLLLAQPALEERQRRALRRAVRSYTTYFLMDVAGKRTFLTGRSVVDSFRCALDAVRRSGSSPSLRTRARFAAKLFYLGVCRRIGRLGQDPSNWPAVPPDAGEDAP